MLFLLREYAISSPDPTSDRVPFHRSLRFCKRASMGYLSDASSTNLVMFLVSLCSISADSLGSTLLTLRTWYFLSATDTHVMFHRLAAIRKRSTMITAIHIYRGSAEKNMTYGIYE